MLLGLRIFFTLYFIEDKIVNNILKPGATPHIFSWKRPNPSEVRRRERSFKRHKAEEMASQKETSVCDNVGNEVEISSASLELDFVINAG